MKCPQCQTELRLVKVAGSGETQPNNGDSELKALLDSIVDDTISGAALEFVTKTRERFEQYGPRTRMSEKQIGWLKDIADGKSGRGDDWS